MTGRRVQRSRARGARLPEGAVVVSRGTSWGNPFTVAEHGRDRALERHAAWLAGAGPDLLFSGSRAYSRTWVLDNLPTLAGQTLACWCPADSPCHGDLLLELAGEALS